MDTVQKGWEDMITQKQAWDKKVDAAIERLERRGWQEEAANLKSTLLAHNLVSHPHDFQVIWNTRFGQETVTVIFQAKSSDARLGAVSRDREPLALGTNGNPSAEESDIEYLHSDGGSDDESEFGSESGSNRIRSIYDSDTDASVDLLASPRLAPNDEPSAGRLELRDGDPSLEGLPSTAEPVPDPPVAQGSSLAEPVETFGVVPKPSCNIRLDTHRILLAKLGFAFCIDCPCDRIFVPTFSADPSEATHDVASPIFYMTFPEIIAHFNDEHEIQSSDLRWILEKYGTTGCRNPVSFLSLMLILSRCSG